MRSFKHIFSFVAVSFILLFNGRISKANLYHAYFRTIADVEIRNQTDFADDDDAYVQPAEFSETSALQPLISAFGLSIFKVVPPVIRSESLLLPQGPMQVFPKGIRLSVAPTRAP